MKTERAMELAILTAKLAKLESFTPKRGTKAYHIAQDAYDMMSHASRLLRLAETECNQELTEGQVLSITKNRNALSELAKAYGLSAKFDGDPRGYVVHLFFPDKSYNTMGGEESGWGI